jgi:hypothetical protein
MIRYALKCDAGHDFDSWFKSAAAFDDLDRRGLLTCGVCGSGTVQKAVMAPRVATSEASVLGGAKTPAEQAVAEIRKRLEAADFVGDAFAREARAIHLGEAPARAIWGQARADEAKSLIEDGVPVAPLPFVPSKKVN